ncbi:FliM/FliN family flagellar motor switch protein [bacterium]|nr:FliM/FliN family flagellar motor switch protein [bacterium]
MSDGFDSQRVGNLEIWQQVNALEKLDAESVRYSLGLLRANLKSLLPDFGKIWNQFAATKTELKIATTDCSWKIGFPEGVQRLHSFLLNDEIAVIGIDQDAEQLINLALAELGDLNPQLKLEVKAQKALTDYLERRLLACAARVWNQHWAKDGAAEVAISYVAPGKNQSAEIIITAESSIQYQGQANRSGKLYCGFGPKAASIIDSAWRAKISAERPIQIQARDLHVVSFEIGSFNLSPSELLDYLRPGAIIPIGTLRLPRVDICVDGVCQAQAELVSFNGKFAARVTEIINAPVETTPVTEGRSLLRVELARVLLEPTAIYEFFQSGAIIPTQVSLAPTALIFMSGERVASGSIGKTSDGKLAISILPK